MEAAGVHTTYACLALWVSEMRSQLTQISSTRWYILLFPAALLTGSAFIIPVSRVPLSRQAKRISSRNFTRRRLSRATYSQPRRCQRSPCLLSSPLPTPGDDDDNDQPDSSNGEGSSLSDAGAGGVAGDGVVYGKNVDDAQNEETNNEEEDSDDISDFFSEANNRAGLKLLAQGDSLPLSYRSDNGTRESEFYLEPGEKENINPYYDVVRRLSPTELIGRFMRSASPRVQEAVRTTVLGLLGSLPRHAFETTAISTGGALANLMFQLQMTGYMFKNAEYRLSLQSSMQTGAFLEDGEGKEEEALEMDDEGRLKMARPKVSGKIKLTYDEDTERERALEVDADAYMAELRGQVENLESRLVEIRQRKEAALEKDLLMYIKSMPESQLKSLTARVSPEVLDAMRLLVQAVMGGMENSEVLAQTLTQQTGSSMAQLCMWQLVVGFNLREMEAREDLRRNFNK